MKNISETFSQKLKVFDYEKTKTMYYPKVRISDEIQQEAYKWCEEQFGNNWIWSSRLQTDYTDIYFINPEDAFIFRLRFETL